MTEFYIFARGLQDHLRDPSKDKDHLPAEMLSEIGKASIDIYAGKKAEKSELVQKIEKDLVEKILAKIEKEEEFTEGGKETIKEKFYKLCRFTMEHGIQPV